MPGRNPMADADGMPLQYPTIEISTEPNVDDGDLVGDDDLLPGALEDHSAVSHPPSSFHSLRPPVSRSSLPGTPGVQAGDTIAGRYQVERVLGRDGHEMVLLVRHLELGQRAVLRFLLPDASALPDAVARFQRGARRAQQSRSEHTERVIDFGRLENGSPYRVAELPRGPSLEEILRVRGELPLEEAVDTVVALCEALAEIHASRTIFRNLSAANVFIERRPDGAPLVKLVQLGACDSLDADVLIGNELAIPGTAMTGSLPYAAPEQFRNPAGVGPGADIWGAGAILYELLTGAPLFQADSPLVLISMIAADSAPPPSTFRSDVPEELDEIVLRCLEKDPSARPQTVAELVELLLPFATENVQAMAERVQRIVSRTTWPPAGSFSIRASSTPPSFGPLPAPSIPPRRSARPFQSLPPPLSRKPLPARYSRNAARPSVWPAVEHTSGAAPERRRHFGWGIVALGAGIGAIAAIAAASLNRPTPAPASSVRTDPPNQVALPARSPAPAASEPARALTPAEAVLTNPRPVARVAAKKPAQELPKSVTPGGAESAAAVPTGAPETAATEQKNGVAKAGALFGGMD